MTEEILRYISVRSPRSASGVDIVHGTDAPSKSEVHRALKMAASRATGTDTVRKLLPELEKKLDGELFAAARDLGKELRSHSSESTRRVTAAVAVLTTSGALGGLAQLRLALVDLLLARLVVGSPQSAETLSNDDAMRTLRAAIVLQTAARGELSDALCDTILTKRVRLPRLPLPPEPAAKPAPADVVVPRLNELRVVDDLRKAKSELEQIQTLLAPPANIDVSREPRRTLVGAEDLPKKTAVAKRPVRQLWHQVASEAVLGVVDRLGLEYRGMPTGDVIDRLNTELEAATAAHPPRAQRRSVRVGMHVVSQDDVRKPGGSIKIPGFGSVGSGGLTGVATVPSGVGRLGPARRGELNIIRQRLKRYEAPEIAHIENVLKGEKHSRRFERIEKLEVTETVATQTISSEERDLQSTERFEMKTATSEVLQASLKLEAGVNVTASYGAVGVEARSSFDADVSSEKSTQAASTFAREVTSRAQSRIESQVSRSRVVQTSRSTAETTHHDIDNSVSPSGHVTGIYRWVNKVYDAQVVNYGLRDLYNFYVPEPAAFWLTVQSGLPAAGITVATVDPPTVTDDGGVRSLRPTDITRSNYRNWVAAYGATNVEPPPPEYFRTTIAIAIEPTTDAGAERSGTVKSVELVVPEGYEVKTVLFRGGGRRSNRNRGSWLVQFGGRRFLGNRWEDDVEEDDVDVGEYLTVDRVRGTVAIILEFTNYMSLAMTMAVKCIPMAHVTEAWQLATYEAIMTGYVALRTAYEDQVRNSTASYVAEIGSRSPAINERVIREELKRCALSMMTGQRFELFDAMRGPTATQPYPEIAFPDAEAEGRYVAFCEQAFEWENMTFVFYPYFWGRKDGWKAIVSLNDVDPLMTAFVKAGFARVQVPVRPTFEDAVELTFAKENWNGREWIGEDVPGFVGGEQMSIEDELLTQTGGAMFVQADGFVTLTAGSSVVTGTGTTFTEDMVDRELRVGGIEYRVIKRINDVTLHVAAPLPAADAIDAQYAVGPKLHGPPWEIVVPTTLVYLQANANLNA